VIACTLVCISTIGCPDLSKGVIQTGNRTNNSSVKSIQSFWQFNTDLIHFPRRVCVQELTRTFQHDSCLYKQVHDESSSFPLLSCRFYRPHFFKMPRSFSRLKKTRSGIQQAHTRTLLPHHPNSQYIESIGSMCLPRIHTAGDVASISVALEGKNKRVETLTRAYKRTVQREKRAQTKVRNEHIIQRPCG
jgi:hypothetical protein